MIQKLKAILFLHIIIIPLMGGLVIDGDPKDLPVYAEYMSRLGMKTTSTPQPLTTSEQHANKKDSPEMQIQIPYAIPAIQLCKEKPADDNFYGHVFCWAMILLFASTILSLLLYLLRSIFWLRLTYNEKRQQLKSKKQKGEEEEFGFPLVTFPFDDGQHTDHKYLEDKSKD